VLGTEATGGALSFMQELRRNEEKHFGKSNLGRMSSCPGENGMHIENWAERIPSVLGKTNRRRKNCAGEQVQLSQREDPNQGEHLAHRRRT
jgi:hypothetical protein